MDLPTLGKAKAAEAGAVRAPRFPARLLLRSRVLPRRWAAERCRRAPPLLRRREQRLRRL
ncbi:unnamed protein product, partial [Closterium sp. NIES-54]